MRFRCKPLPLTLLTLFVAPAVASAEDAPLRLDRTFHNLPNPQEATAAFVSADHLEGKKDDKMEVHGNVVLRQYDQTLHADRLEYDPNTRDVEASGNVRLEQGHSTLDTPRLKLNLDTHVGDAEQLRYYIGDNGGHGQAEKLHMRDKQHYDLERVNYSTCPVNQIDWQLTTGKLEIDHERQVGEAHNTWVSFLGVPILYAPWMDFPLGHQRKTGFLAPLFGGTTKGGTELTIPFYWNIAPNFDATFSPRIISKRGVQFNNEFRYLLPSARGEMRVDVLPNDAMTNRNRARVALKHQQSLGGGTSVALNFNRVTDDAYFRDLADSVTTTSQVNLLQDASISHNAGWWNAALRLQRYQTLQDPLAPIAFPYARLPQVAVGASQAVGGGVLAFAGEYVSFSHPSALNAQRLVLNPSFKYPLFSAPWGYVTPKIALHSTHYSMGANNLNNSQNASRSLPLFSLDSGMTLERSLELFGSKYTHTLEPRLFYVFVPYRKQDLLPNFDTAQADFSFVQMFSENRFFGSDRIGDANQVTAALTSRLLDENAGAERLRATVGQRFSFSPPQVNLVAPTSNTGRSDILLALAGQVDKQWYMDGEYQFDPNQSKTQRYNVVARYRPEPGKVLNFGYRFTRDTVVGTLVPGGTTVYTPIGGLRQVDISGQWPLSGRWHAVGRWNYSFQDRRLLDSVLGLEYNQSCWTFRLVAQRYTTSTQQSNSGVFVQLELNDFMKVGSDPLIMLKRSVPGYEKTNEKTVLETTPVLR